MNEIDFIDGIPHSKMRATLDNGGYVVNSDLSMRHDGTFVINIDNQNSNPVHAQKFLENRKYNYNAYDPFDNDDLLNSGTSWEMNFSFSPNLPGDERLSEIALLKIAYLIAFQKFGYSFLINPHLYKVREQILNPEKDILPKLLGIKYEFPEVAVGINIINKPVELQCYLIVFKLTTKCKVRQYAIALPGPEGIGSLVYTNLEELLCKEGRPSVSFNLEHLPDVGYTREKKDRFASLTYWRQLTSSVK